MLQSIKYTMITHPTKGFSLSQSADTKYIKAALSGVVAY